MSTDKRNSTVLFADVTGSTKLYELVGDSRALEKIAACIAALRKAVEDSGGRVVKTMGDSIMALFGGPDAAAIASGRMQYAIQDIKPVGQAKLGVRIGFHVGQVIQRDDDVYGDTVNVAYRLHEQAIGGQVLTTEETVNVLPGYLRSATRHLYRVDVKGKAGGLNLFEYVWQQDPDITDMAKTVSALRGHSARLRLKYRGKDLVRRRGPETLVIGRDASCHLVIADHKASRRHCTIERRNENFVLQDHSTNGTFVTIEGEAEVALRRDALMLRRHGVISFGQSREQAEELVEFYCE